ncbi:MULTISPECIES: VOC family protein [unclassified Luteococcus]|uniref:VOC family protein n=1 Tax=unclassified Luteococcus TaxID=2639923 RepID=UPI00313B9C7B
MIPGSPTWMDLGTHDVEGAKAFYTQLFGWDFLDQGPDFGGYLMIKQGDGFVGGAMSSLMTPEGPAEEPQYPTSWTIYLRVEDIDAALAKVEPNGGQVMVPAMQVGESGKMAVVVDAAGAVVGMWQPLDFDGYDFTGQPGTPVWFETMSKDYDAAVAFYAEVFGWDVTAMPGIPEGQPRYATNGGGERAACGICEADSFLPDEVPSFWRMYLQVADTDQAVARIQELGGRLLDGPMDSPFGRLATVADPQGAMFQVITSAMPG